MSLAIGEFAARLFHLSKTYNSYPWLLQKGSSVTYSPEKNSYGWRDREFTKRKKINTLRIACIGDSVTEGYRVKLENTFPKILEDKFQDMNYDIEVMNLGSCGNTTSDNLSAVKAVMDFSPDLIVYQFGLNDIEGFEHVKRISHRDGMPTSNVAIKKKKEFNLKALLRKSVLYLALAERYNYLKLKVGYRNWAFDEWDIKDAMLEREFTKLKKAFSEIQNRSKILIIYVPYDFQVYSTREEVFVLSRKLDKFCQDNNYYFVDFTRIFKVQKDRYNLLLDDSHLSNYGNEIVAKYLGDFILREIIHFSRYPAHQMSKIIISLNKNKLKNYLSNSRKNFTYNTIFTLEIRNIKK